MKNAVQNAIISKLNCQTVRALSDCSTAQLKHCKTKQGSKDERVYQQFS